VCAGAAYTLGAMYACQIFRKAEKDIPNLATSISAGRFKDLKEWLNKSIHEKGSVFRSGDEIMKAVTGEPLNVAVFTSYLTQKYRGIYKLK